MTSWVRHVGNFVKSECVDLVLKPKYWKKEWEEEHCNSKSYCFYSRRTNPFLPNVVFLYTLKTSENQRFSHVFRGYKKRTLGRMGLKSKYLRHNPSYKIQKLRSNQVFISPYFQRFGRYSSHSQEQVIDWIFTKN